MKKTDKEHKPVLRLIPGTKAEGCSHKNFEKIDWPDGSVVELCHDCGLSRNLKGDFASAWCMVEDVHKAKVEIEEVINKISEDLGAGNAVKVLKVMNTNDAGTSNEEKTRSMMGAAADIMVELFPCLSFSILVFDSSGPGVANYVSNANRKEIITAMRETADRLENNTMDDHTEEILIKYINDLDYCCGYCLELKQEVAINGPSVIPKYDGKECGTIEHIQKYYSHYMVMTHPQGGVNSND